MLRISENYFIGNNNSDSPSDQPTMLGFVQPNFYSIGPFCKYKVATYNFLRALLLAPYILLLTLYLKIYERFNYPLF